MNRDWVVQKSVELAKLINTSDKVPMDELEKYLEYAYNKGIMDVIDQMGQLKGGTL